MVGRDVMSIRISTAFVFVYMWGLMMNPAKALHVTVIDDDFIPEVSRDPGLATSIGELYWLKVAMWVIISSLVTQWVVPRKAEAPMDLNLPKMCGLAVVCTTQDAITFAMIFYVKDRIRTVHPLCIKIVRQGQQWCWKIFWEVWKLLWWRRLCPSAWKEIDISINVLNRFQNALLVERIKTFLKECAGVWGILWCCSVARMR